MGMTQQVVRGILSALIVGLIATPAAAQAPAQAFEQACSACHSIGGGPRLGPDLSGVTTRRDREWLVRFILDPQAVVDTGDAYAAGIVADAGGLIMPAAPFDAEMVRALLDYIDAQAAGAAGSPPAAALITDRAFGAEDVQAGRNVFTGTTRLDAQGPACVACHHVPNVGRLGGGTLGPDLTQVITRLRGRQSLGAWLQAPATPVMRELFQGRRLTPAEIESLLALFEESATAPPVAPARQTFLALGTGGAALALTLFGWVWRNRFRSVRRPLVNAPATGGSR